MADKPKLEEMNPNDFNPSNYPYVYTINKATGEIELEKGAELPAVVEESFLTSLNTGNKIAKPYWNPYELEWLLKYNSTHRRCMELKSTLVAGFGYDIRNKEHKNYEKLKAFLKRPNSVFGDTFSKILMKTVRNKYSYGYGPLIINKAFDVIQMYASTNTKAIFMIPNTRGGYQSTGIRKYIQFSKVNKQSKKEFFPYDGEPKIGRSYIYMLGYKTFSNSYYPEPEYLPIKDKIYEDIYIDKNNMDFFKNRTMGDYIILFSGARLNKKKKELVKDVLDENGGKFRGIGNQHKTMVLHSPDKDSSVKIVDLSKNEDGQYSKRQAAIENAIARAWGITPSLISIISGGSGFGGGSIKIGDLFLENQIMIRPEQRDIEEDINLVLESLFEFDPQIKLRTIDTNNQKDMAIILNTITSSGTPIAKLEARKYIHEHGIMEFDNPNIIPEGDDLIISNARTQTNIDGDLRTDESTEQLPDDITSIDENKFNDDK